ncbi:MAG TPA: hypothetical protein VJ723_07445 [Candidatus Angelobacter sp.]|nr:hypothetical protein [Candidatus Angelobacter sp.]
MKNGILKMIVIALLLAASGSSTVLALEDGVPPPICYPKACGSGNAR